MSNTTFPNNPTLNQEYLASNGTRYIWDGVKWKGVLHRLPTFSEIDRSKLVQELSGTSYQNLLNINCTPTIDINFFDYISEPQGVHPRITFNRDSLATRYNHKGLLQIIEEDKIRHSYDQDGNYIGVLLENEKINLITNPITQTIAVSEQQYTLSFYGDGQIILSGAYTYTLNGTSNHRTIHVFTPDEDDLTLTISGDVNYINLETGNVSTYISNSPRLKDDMSIVGLNFSEWYNEYESTIVFPFYLTNIENRDLLILSDGTNNNVIKLLLDSNHLYLRVINDSSQELNLHVSEVGIDIKYRCVFAYNANSISLLLNQNAILTETDLSIPTNISQLDFGTYYYIDYFRIFPRKLNSNLFGGL